MTRYQRERKKRLSERARRGGLASQAVQRKKREALAALDPIKLTGQIKARIVLIIGETQANEVTFYDFDGYRVTRRKLLAISRKVHQCVTPEYQTAA